MKLGSRIPDGPLAETPYAKAVAAALSVADPEVHWPVELDEDRVPSLRTGGDVLVRNATIMTADREGVLEGADMLVRNGRIVALQKGIVAPEGAENPHRQFSASGPTLSLLEATPEALTMRTLDAGGRTVDRLRLTRRSPR